MAFEITVLHTVSQINAETLGDIAGSKILGTIIELQGLR